VRSHSKPRRDCIQTHPKPGGIITVEGRESTKATTEADIDAFTAVVLVLKNLTSEIDVLLGPSSVFEFGLCANLSYVCDIQIWK